MTDLTLPKVSFDQACAYFPGAQRYYDGDLDGVSALVSGQFKLAPGSVFIAAPVPEPFAFVAQVGARRTNVVVAREYGDLEWPAFIKAQHAAAQHDVRKIVAEGFREVNQWLRDAWRTAEQDLNAGLITVNEYRKRIGLPPLSDDEERVLDHG